MNYKRTYVTNVGNMAEQFEGLDKLLAGLDPTLEFKGNNCARALALLALITLVISISIVPE